MNITTIAETFLVENESEETWMVLTYPRDGIQCVQLLTGNGDILDGTKRAADQTVFQRVISILQECIRDGGKPIGTITIIPVGSEALFESRLYPGLEANARAVEVIQKTVVDVRQ